MNPQSDPLAQLKPIHLPVEPSWFPPAPGWWLLGTSLLVLLATVSYWLFRRYQRAAPLRQALAELDQLQTEHDVPTRLLGLNHLLRRAARQVHGPYVASLEPQAWAQFLHQHAPADLQTDAQTWQGLAEAPYQPEQPQRSGEWVALARAWLRGNLPC